MWQLSGSPRIYLDVFPITSWHRHLACHCLGTGETSWIQRGGHEAMSRSWDSIIEPETESWHHYLLTRQEQEVKHHGCCSGDKWSVSELCSVWWPVVTMGPMSGLACSSRLGPGHLRFYCIPILLISKLPTPMKFGISLQLKPQDKSIFCVCYVSFLCR